MTSVEPYLNFNGNCESAMELYKQAFRGELTFINRYGDNSMPVADEHKKWIMHANFRAGEIKFMMSDVLPQYGGVSGSAVQLSINNTDTAEQDRIWNVLAEGATIRMPLAEQFWGARFGMLTDRFGISWMFNCELPKAS